MPQFQPKGYNILPTVVKNLLIINGLVFLAQFVLPGVLAHTLGPRYIEDHFALHYWQSSLFRPFQIVTSMFMHGGMAHILFNMFALWMFGSILENQWGPKRFLIFYMICGIGAALCFLAVQTIQFHQLPGSDVFGYLMGLNPFEIQNTNMKIARFLYEPVLGASGAIFGLLVAFGVMYPNSMIYLYFFVPIKTKWFVIGYIAIELFAGVQNNQGDNVAHFAHLGGALFGYILMKIWQKKGVGRNPY